VNINIQLQTTPLDPLSRDLASALTRDTGAWVEFRGLVRDQEQDQSIRALDYEAYVPMAEKTLHQIAAELGQEYPCQAVVVRHRIGQIPAGDAAIYVGVIAAHRQEAFSFLSAFMDRLKREVPIWKTGSVQAA